MEIVTDSDLRLELVGRKARIEKALGGAPQSAGLVGLLNDVDAALARFEKEAYGICETCHDPIERDRLAADPLMRYCIDHLTTSQREELQQDLDLAARVQGALLPKRGVQTGEWDVAYLYEPLGAVSGDYCDLIQPDGDGGGGGGGAPLFLVGDVSGKGVAASMLTAHLHALFRSLSTIGLPIAQFMQRANRVFCESVLPGSFATLVCLRADRGGEIEYCNAGHCPMILIRPDGETMIPATNLPIGMFCTQDFVGKRFQMEPGDALLLYTDGLTEARNPADREYGVERLTALLAGRAGGTAQATVDLCRSDLALFQRGAPRKDDLTIMAIRRRLKAEG